MFQGFVRNIDVVRKYKDIDTKERSRDLINVAIIKLKMN